MDFDKLFKEYCLKQNPNETVSGGCAVFVLGFVDFLKEQAVEHSVQRTVEACRADHAAFERTAHCLKYCPSCGVRLYSR